MDIYNTRAEHLEALGILVKTGIPGNLKPQPLTTRY